VPSEAPRPEPLTTSYHCDSCSVLAAFIAFSSYHILRGLCNSSRFMLYSRRIHRFFILPHSLWPLQLVSENLLSTTRLSSGNFPSIFTFLAGVKLLKVLFVEPCSVHRTFINIMHLLLVCKSLAVDFRTQIKACRRRHATTSLTLA
jgi:hypothetical protein